MKKQLVIIGMTILLIIIGFSGCTEQKSIDSNSNIVENQHPTAHCSADTYSGILPLTVNFSGWITNYFGENISYYWDFDDGTTSTEKNPTYTFQNTGEYIVTFAARSDDNEVEESTITINVLPPNKPPLVCCLRKCLYKPAGGFSCTFADTTT